MTGNSSIDISLTNMWLVWRAFRRSKKPSRAIILFEANLEANLLRLCADLNTHKYRHGSYEHKIINERKRRDIAVANVCDRIVHRLLYDFLVPIVDARLDYDVWSCRRNKGLYIGLRRAQQLLNRYSEAWFWRAGIVKFFDNVDHSRLRSILKGLVNDATAFSLLEEVIGSYKADSTGKGVPIGNLTSQIFANIYLNEFDRFVRHSLKPLGYMRYGDDFVLIFSSRNKALAARDFGREWLLENLKLVVHPKNDVIKRVRQGLFILGHRIYSGQPLVVDKFMAHKIEKNLNIQNAVSYRAMFLSSKQAKYLPWKLI